MLLELYFLLLPSLNILDGITIHEGNGPSSGKPRDMGLLAMSENGLALDYHINNGCAFPYSNPLSKVIKNEYPHYLENNCFPWKQLTDFPLDTIEPPDQYEEETLAFRRGFIKYLYQYFFMSRPRINRSHCTQCGHCINHCPADAIRKNLTINYWRCIRCYCCQELCPSKAIQSRKPLCNLPGR